MGMLLSLCAIWHSLAQEGADSSLLPGDVPDQTFHLSSGFVVDVVAGELVGGRPVAIDWGADGRLWVAEVNDGPGPAGAISSQLGRIRFFADTDQDGQYDRATVFLDALPRPSSVFAWGRGVLIGAAPDLVYAEDTNADGRADVAQRLWVGFDAENPLLRLNSLSLGLDHWIWGANGTRGGFIRAMGRLDSTTAPLPTEMVSLAGHDFRFEPGTGQIETVSGQSANARTRDDWGNWFGCDAGGSVWQYPLPYRYRLRNPHVPFPADAVLLFQAPVSSNPARSASSFCLNRGPTLGADTSGSGLLWDPAHGRLRRLTLTRSGITFTAQEAPASATWLSSSDPAFEPVQMRIGPDGALWVVDRGGSPALSGSAPTPTAGAGVAQSAGRILRLRLRDQPTAAIRDLTRMRIDELVAALDSANGVERDRVHTHLLHRSDARAAAPLRELVKQSRWPACRAQALCVLDGLGALNPKDIESGLQDPDPGVRVQAVRLSEPFLRRGVPEPDSSSLLKLTADPAKPVRYQLALTFGEWNDPRAGKALGELATVGLADKWLRAALLSASAHFPDEILKAVLQAESAPAALAGFVDSLAVTAANTSSDAVLERFVGTLNRQASVANEALAMIGLARLVEVIRHRVPDSETTDSRNASPGIQVMVGRTALLRRAQAVARDHSAPEEARVAAVRLLGQAPDPPEADLEFLGQLLVDSDATRLKENALNALVATRHPRVAALLLSRWSHQPPSIRRGIVGLLIARPEWATQLLDALHKGIVATTEVTPSNRERLLTDPDPRIRDQAAKALAARLPDRRRDVLGQFASALSLTGDADKGRATYENLCSRCHAVSNVGANVGPDLSALGSRTNPELLESILDPSATIEPRFVNYQIETDDDRSLSGVLTSEDGAQLTLVQAGGKSDVVALKAITDLRASNLSLMPEGLEHGLTPQDLADLLAFIRSLAR